MTRRDLEERRNQDCPTIVVIAGPKAIKRFKATKRLGTMKAYVILTDR